MWLFLPVQAGESVLVWSHSSGTTRASWESCWKMPENHSTEDIAWVTKDRTCVATVLQIYIQGLFLKQLKPLQQFHRVWIVSAFSQIKRFFFVQSRLILLSSIPQRPQSPRVPASGCQFHEASNSCSILPPSLFVFYKGSSHLSFLFSLRLSRKRTLNVTQM